MSGEIFDLTGSYQAAFVNGIAWNLLNVSIATFPSAALAPRRGEVRAGLVRHRQPKRAGLRRRHRIVLIDPGVAPIDQSAAPAAIAASRAICSGPSGR